MADIKNLKPPYLRAGNSKFQMMIFVFSALTLIALVHSFKNDAVFMVRYAAYIITALVMECLFVFLSEGKLKLPSSSTAVTAALLVLSLPSEFPFRLMLAGLSVAVIFGKLMTKKSKLRLNPMLLGRLFLLVFAVDAVQSWGIESAAPQTVTSATPLVFYSFEKITLSPFNLLLGNIRETWLGIYTVIPGSPADTLPLLTIIAGIFLYFKNVIDWRQPLAFLTGFVLFCFILNMPVVFSLLSGSLIFSAVFIITDPKTTPASKSGRLIAGVLAGALTAVIRYQGYYPEGVVIAVLAVNLFSPALDRISFWIEAKIISKRT